MGDLRGCQKLRRMSKMSDIKFRHELSDGGIVTILKYKSGGGFICYVVSPIMGEAPETLCESDKIGPCQNAAADRIRDDILEVY